MGRAVKADESWEAVRKGGSTGLFLVIVSLFWWKSRASTATAGKEFASAVEDVSWVLNQVVRNMDSVHNRSATAIVAVQESMPTEKRLSNRKTAPTNRKRGLTGLESVY